MSDVCAHIDARGVPKGRIRVWVASAGPPRYPPWSLGKWFHQKRTRGGVKARLQGQRHPPCNPALRALADRPQNTPWASNNESSTDGPSPGTIRISLQPAGVTIRPARTPAVHAPPTSSIRAPLPTSAKKSPQTIENRLDRQARDSFRTPFEAPSKSFGGDWPQRNRGGPY
jgi:hypothetical protein